MKSFRKSIFVFTLLAAFIGFAASGFAQAEARIAEIQAVLREQKLDGWLFYDFRGSDILAPRILKTEGLADLGDGFISCRQRASR